MVAPNHLRFPFSPFVFPLWSFVFTRYRFSSVSSVPLW